MIGDTNLDHIDPKHRRAAEAAEFYQYIREWCLLVISQTILFTREDIRRHENVAIRTPI